MKANSYIGALRIQPELVVFYPNAPSSHGGGLTKFDPNSRKILELGKRFVEEVLQPLRKNGTKVLLMCYDEHKLAEKVFPAEWLAAHVDNREGKILDCYSTPELMAEVRAHSYGVTAKTELQAGPAVPVAKGAPAATPAPSAGLR